MDFLKDRRIAFALIGAVVALAAGLIIAGVLVRGQRGEANAPPPASRAGLVIDPTAPDDSKMRATKPLRCFVAGQFVGELTLADCARKNGVATDALDVGLDQTGALAAADQAGAILTPLPLVQAAPAPQAVQPDVGQAAAGPPIGPIGACWRYGEGQWRRLPNDMTLGACVQTLFANRCERPGGATYGRWMQQTLRLVVGKVEMSADNRNFHSIAEQSANCVIGPVG